MTVAVQPSTMETEPAAAKPRRQAADPFGELFHREYGRVVAIANRVLADPGEAEDVAQEVFLDFHRRHRADAAYAAPWLHAAAAHTALNRIRGRKRRERRELGYHHDRQAGVAPEQQDPARIVEAEEQRERVRVALRRLKPKAAAVLVLRYSGLSYAEVGAALRVGTGQVGTLLRRAEVALRKEFESDASL